MPKRDERRRRRRTAARCCRACGLRLENDARRIGCGRYAERQRTRSRLCRRTHLFVARAGRRKYRCDGCRKGFAACFLDGHDAARRGQKPLCADYPARRYRVGPHAAGFRGTQRCGRRNEKRRSAENPHFRGYTQRKLVDARLSDAVGQGGKRLRRGCRYPPDAGGQYRPRSQLDRQTLCRGGGILHSRGRRDYGQYQFERQVLAPFRSGSLRGGQTDARHVGYRRAGDACGASGRRGIYQGGESQPPAECGQSGHLCIRGRYFYDRQDEFLLQDRRQRRHVRCQRTVQRQHLLRVLQRSDGRIAGG